MYLLLFSFLLTATFALNWKNINWQATSSENPLPPGPNYWKSENAYIDGNGALHLNISYDSSMRRWYAVSLQAPNLYSYGIYQWQLGSRLDKLDLNLVLGLFLYPSNGPDGTDEIDIEFSQWGSANEPGLGLTVWPNHHYNVPKKNEQLPVSPSPETTARFTWTPGSVRYEYFEGHVNINSHDNPLHTYNVTGNVVASDPQYLLMNFWIFDQKPPSAPVTVIISDFQYKAV